MAYSTWAIQCDLCHVIHHDTDHNCRATTNHTASEQPPAVQFPMTYPAAYPQPLPMPEIVTPIKDAELARLRARVAELEAEQADIEYLLAEVKRLEACLSAHTELECP